MPTQGPEFLSTRLRPLALALALLAPAWLAWLIYQYGTGSLHWDEWGCEVPVLRAWLSGSFDWNALAAQCNESRPVLPKIYWLLTTLATGVADPRFQMFTGWLIVCATAWNVYRLSGNAIWFAVCANVLLFSPAQWENWLWGAQMMLHLPALYLTTWLRVATSASRHKVPIGAALAVAASYSFANGFLLWPALFATLALLPREERRRAMLFWAATLIATLVLYFRGYERGTASPNYAAVLTAPAQAVDYIFHFLGGPLAAGQASRAEFAGIFLVCGLAGMALQARLRSIWFILAGYALASATLAAVGRAALGTQQALDSRYTTFALWLVVSLLAIAFQSYKRLKWALAAAILVTQVDTYREAHKNMHYRSLAARYHHACLTFVLALPGGDCNGNYPVWSVDFLREAAQPLDRAGWLRPRLRRPHEPVPAGFSEGMGNIEPVDAAEKWRFQGGVGADADAIVIAVERGPEWIPIGITSLGRMVPLQNVPSAYRSEMDKAAVPAGSRVAAFAYRSLASGPRWVRLGTATPAQSKSAEGVTK
jgi:hypothetical protein